MHNPCVAYLFGTSGRVAAGLGPRAIRDEHLPFPNRVKI